MTKKKTPKLNTSKLISTLITEKPYPISDHPYCALPEHYFDAAKAKVAYLSKTSETVVPKVQARSVLTIETWEGRKVISHESII